MLKKRQLKRYCVLGVHTRVMVTHHSDRRPVWSHWMVWHHVLSPSSRASVMEVGVVIVTPTPIVISAATVITALTTGVAVTV